MVSTEYDTYVALGRIQRQHDAVLHALYKAWVRRPEREDINAYASDPELTYNLDCVEAIGDYLTHRDYPEAI